MEGLGGEPATIGEALKWSVNEWVMPFGDVFVVSSETGRSEREGRVSLSGIKTALSQIKKEEDWL